MSDTPEAAPIARQTMAIHTGMRKWSGVNCVAPPIILSTVFERPEESVDIDTEWDWMVAQAAIETLRGQGDV